jgi:DNA-binding MarR family transcriptional regulator
LHQVSDDARAALEAALAELGIDLRQYRIAWLIREFGPQSQVALCDMMRVDRASMVKFVDRLQAQGWVTREPHPSDRRQNAVTLSAKGRKALKSADAVAHACEDRSLAALSAEQRATLGEILKALAHRGPVSG